MRLIRKIAFVVMFLIAPAVFVMCVYSNILQPRQILVELAEDAMRTPSQTVYQDYQFEINDQKKDSCFHFAGSINIYVKPPVAEPELISYWRPPEMVTYFLS